MRIEYSKPAPNERYLVDKKAARAVVRETFPDLKVLAFQTRHGPKMTPDIPYCATYRRGLLRLLSVAENLVTDAMAKTFVAKVVPWMVKRVAEFERSGYYWPMVVVVIDGAFVEVSCSEGWVFPNFAEIRESKRRRGQNCVICPVATEGRSR
jgi:hypothetical protein